MLPTKLQHIIDKLPQGIREIIAVVVSFFEGQLSKKEARIKELEAQLGKNSKNSSTPPSTDNPHDKPAPKSRRTKSGKKAGGQKGHKGTTLKMTPTPDEIKAHKVITCINCGEDLSAYSVESTQRRQSYDIPPLSILVTEHQSEVKRCSCGCKNTNFPDFITSPVQYGPNLKGLLVYLQNYQLLPYSRTAELMEDLFGQKISCGTLYNAQKYAYEQLEPFETALKEVLREAPILGFDETGFRIQTKCWWLHSCSTDKHAYYQVHEKRGSEAMDDIGILPEFEGIAIHDFWKSYLTYDCTHALCNAHLIRELVFIHEQFDQVWAKELIDLLLDMKKAKEKAMEDGKTSLDKAILGKFDQKYDHILDKGFAINPFEAPVYKKGQKKKRGRPKKTKARNLLERLQAYKADIIRFCKHFAVPFDNNFSERDIRMMKLKQKISGCFRSKLGAQYFARIRSFIISTRKQGKKVLEELTNIFTLNNVWKNIAHGLEAE